MLKQIKKFTNDLLVDDSNSETKDMKISFSSFISVTLIYTIAILLFIIYNFPDQTGKELIWLALAIECGIIILTKLWGPKKAFIWFSTYGLAFFCLSVLFFFSIAMWGDTMAEVLNLPRLETWQHRLVQMFEKS